MRPRRDNGRSCPYCLTGSELAGTRISSYNELFFALVVNKEGMNKAARVLIITRGHHASMAALPEDWGPQFCKIYEIACGILRDQGITSFNPFWCVGDAAGQTIVGHWCVSVEPRLDGQPSSGMNPAYVIAKYDAAADRALAT